MAVIQLETPVYVRCQRSQGQRGYRIRPLFAPALVGHHREFERAMRACAKAVRAAFRGFEMQAGTLDSLAWLTFSPDYRVETHSFELRAGRVLEHLPVTTVVFDAGCHRWVCLPALDNHLFPIAADARWAQVLERTQAEIHGVLRTLRRGTTLEREDLKAFAAGKGDFVTTLDVSVDAKPGRFAFDPAPLAGFFAMMNEEQQFHGDAELPRVALDLTHAYPDGLQRTERADPRVERLAAALYGPDALPTVLLGPTGAGRTTLLHEALAQRIEAHEAEHDKLEKLWLLDPTRVIAGMAVVGAWQRRAEAIFEWVQIRLTKRYQIPRPDALYIDNPVALCRVGRSAGGDLTLAAVLRPWIERRAFPVIIEATPEQWQRVEELDRPLADLFQTVRVPEPPREQALRIFVVRRGAIEARSGCRFQRDALRRIVEIEDRYPSTVAKPGSLVRRLEQLAATHPYAPIDELFVEAAFRERSHLHPRILDTSEPLEDEALRELVERGLVGQPDATQALCDVVHALRAGVAEPGRPVGSMLFLGPTGVGKTEAAKVLARVLYGDERAGLLRFDMNEYVDSDAVARLVGDLHRPEGQLTGQVRHRPFCVLLLDEIEKAHPSVRDLLLQLLDEGRLTDALGRLTDFTRTVVIMTSNVGAREATRQLGFEPDGAAVSASYRAALRASFRPEFLNRVDRVVVFDSLGPTDIRSIARLQLGRLMRREGFQRRTTLLELGPGALEHVAERGFDPQLGARALKRSLERTVVAPLSQRMVGLAHDQPMLLRMDLAEGKLEPGIHPLAMAQEGEVPSLARRVADLERVETARWMRSCLERMRDRLRDQAGADLGAEASPSGSRVPPGFRVLGRLANLDEELDRIIPSNDPMDALPTAGRREVAPALRRSPHQYHRSFHYRPGEAASYQRVRDYLLDQLEVPDENKRPWDEDPVVPLIEDLALSRLQVQALVHGHPTRCCLHLRLLGAESSECWKHVDPLIEAWMGLAELAWGAAEREPVPRRVDATAGGTSLLRVEGLGLYDLLAGERGIHVFYPPGSAPFGLQVRIGSLAAPDQDPSPLLERWDRPELGDEADRRVIRLYAPRDAFGGHGAVTDLRSGVLGYWPVQQGELLSWLLPVLPSELSLEIPS